MRGDRTGCGRAVSPVKGCSATERQNDGLFRKPTFSGSLGEWRLSPKRLCPALHRKRAPSGSNLRILGEGKSILHVDSKIADRILDFAMALYLNIAPCTLERHVEDVRLKPRTRSVSGTARPRPR